ncbi:hypothetical protein [Aquamicrobium sp.]|uniref:hypothetical protein n=1 Tax=Aquamicrobium sp. TaxID=1872579 RepID=UPI00258C2731|nr:hypothetical protein [Aquamicrobium sp.]MCK9553111.1 hypothetical protein [Aquamicrobium sp.]
MITVNQNRNGTYLAQDIESMDHEAVKTISDARVIKVLECFKIWDGNKIETITDQTFYVIDGHTAYPFSIPFYEADEDEEIEAQKFPETWEDVIGLMESFGH